MNKKILAIAIPVDIVVLLGIISAKPNNVSGPNTDAAPAKKTINTANMSVALASADKVEVFVFHRTQRCISCITMGKFAEKTVVGVDESERADESAGHVFALGPGRAAVGRLVEPARAIAVPTDVRRDKTDVVLLALEGHGV